MTFYNEFIYGILKATKCIAVRLIALPSHFDLNEEQCSNNINEWDRSLQITLKCFTVKYYEKIDLFLDKNV